MCRISGRPGSSAFIVALMLSAPQRPSEPVSWITCERGSEQDSESDETSDSKFMVVVFDFIAHFRL